MYLLWLRVAAILYAAAASPSFRPCSTADALAQDLRPPGRMAFFFHFVSVVEMLVQAHRWMPVGVREVESLLGFAVAGLFFLVWWLYDAISLGIFALPAHSFLVFVPALGPDRYTFPSQGVRTVGWWPTLPRCWRPMPLCFSLLASVLYLVQERRIKSKPKPGEDSWWAAAGLAAAPRHAGAHRPRHAGVRLSLHDRRPGDRLGAGAGDAARRAYFPRSQGHCFLHQWAVYVTLLLCSPQRRNARPQGRLSLRRGLSGDAGRAGRQPLQPRAQVRSAMTLALIGVNHKTAPIELRERIAISREDLPETTRALAAMPGVAECMIVSTCNRVEMLAAVESPMI
jgi:hypothetical protein